MCLVLWLHKFVQVFSDGMVRLSLLYWDICPRELALRSVILPELSTSRKYCTSITRCVPSWLSIRT